MAIPPIDSKQAPTTPLSDPPGKKQGPAKEGEKVQTAVRPALVRAGEAPNKPLSCSQRTWECIKSVPLIGHLLRAIIWIIKAIAGLIFGDPVAAYKKSLTKEHMSQLLEEVDKRVQQLNKSINAWSMNGVLDLIRLTAACNDLDMMQDSMTAFQEQFSLPSKVGKEGKSNPCCEFNPKDYDTAKAQRLRKECEDIHVKLKEKVEENLKPIQERLEEVEADIEKKEQALKEILDAAEEDNDHQVRSARLLLLYACDNYIRSFKCLLRLQLVPEEDRTYQHILEVSTELRKEMHFKGHLPEVWARQAANTSNFPELTPHDIGIQNIGNSCYMNSSLQVLFGMDTFGDLIQQELQQGENESKADFKGRCKVQKALKAVAEAILAKDSTQIRKAMTRFRVALFNSNIASDFKWEPGYELSRQHDGPAFILAVLGALDFTIQCKKARIVQHGNTRYEVSSKTSSQGMLLLNLPKKDGSTLQEIFQQQYKPEQLNANKPFKVRIEGQSHQFTKFALQERITGSIPDSLPVQIVRFQNDGSKNATAVDCRNGGRVDLTNIFDPAIRGEDPIIYKVVSFQMHHGDSSAGGHYTAYSHCPDGKWRHYDDSYVTEVSDEEAEREMAYAYTLMLKRV